MAVRTIGPYIVTRRARRDPSPDRRGSANRRSPKASFDGSAGGGGGTGVIGSCSAAACGPRGCDPRAAPVVIVITNNSARHLPALERRKYDPAGTRHPAVRSASWPCVSRILELDAGNSDVLQGSVVDRPPGRSDTADLAFAEDPRPQPGNDRSDRADPSAPDPEFGRGSYCRAAPLPRGKCGWDWVNPVPASVDPVPAAAKAIEERVFPIVGIADGSGDVVAGPLSLKAHRHDLSISRGCR